MDVTLSPDIESAAERLVRSGRYASQADAVVAAVRLLDEEERALADVRTQLQEGAAALDRGDAHTLEAVTEILQRDHEEQFGPHSHRPSSPA